MKKILDMKKILMLFMVLICVLCLSSTAQAGIWVKDSNGWWYMNDDGSYPANIWFGVDGDWYHFDENGYMSTGWIYVNDWYYLDDSGKMLRSSWTPDGYYVDSTGRWRTNCLVYDDGWYILDESGKVDMHFQSIDKTYKKGCYRLENRKPVLDE